MSNNWINLAWKKLLFFFNESFYFRCFLGGGREWGQQRTCQSDISVLCWCHTHAENIKWWHNKVCVWGKVDRRRRRHAIKDQICEIIHFTFFLFLQNKNLPIENTTDCLSTMATVCKVMLETPWVGILCTWMQLSSDTSSLKSHIHLKKLWSVVFSACLCLTN